MRIVLWDTRQLDVAKDFAGGYGVGHYHGLGGLRGRLVRYFYKRDRRPVSLSYAYLTAIFRRLGHTVEYAEDDVPVGADVYVFNPALITLGLERAAMERVVRNSPRARILVVGLVAYALPEAFAGLPVTLVRGEAEQLLWKLDDVLNAGPGGVDVGSVRDLDRLPFPDWSPFRPQRFRVAYDFWKFPTGYIQQSRGCTFTCNYCPYIVVENATRFRSPESVADELDHGMRTYGFRSFKFRDPLFGLDRKRVMELADRIGHLSRPIQFSIEGRIDLLREETLRTLKRVGLASVTVGIETPDEETLRTYKRAPIRDDKQREFVALCRSLGVRTVAGFMIGFPHDTARSIHAVLRYAKQVNPTYANFNIVTPYPGTEFFEQVRHQIADFDFTRYSVYTPVLKYEHLTHEQVRTLHARCFTSFYFRSLYLLENAHLLWPFLQRLGIPRRTPLPAASVPSSETSPAPHRGLDVLESRPGLRKDGPHIRRPENAKPADRRAPN
jgi:anaerobic magnesium-protoporphyrin IX monomethyl ester cyclase